MNIIDTLCTGNSQACEAGSQVFVSTIIKFVTSQMYILTTLESHSPHECIGESLVIRKLPKQDP